MMIIVWILHGILCIITYLLLRLGVLKTRGFVMPAVIFVPVFGLLLLLQEEYAQRSERMGRKEIGNEKLKINDAKYRRIDVDEGKNQDITVPLEEAILVNDTVVRRKLMLDILHRNPEEYIDLLKRTRLGTDAELTHYATTTMMEIQSSYELNLQKYGQEMTKKRDDSKLLKRYSRELEDYLNSGLISGNILLIYRNQWDAVLKKLTELYPENKGYRLKKIANQIEAGNLSEVKEELTKIDRRWPKDEAVYRLLVIYYRRSGQGNLIAELIDTMKKEEVYLSHEGKKWFAFWENEEQWHE